MLKLKAIIFGVFLLLLASGCSAPQENGQKPTLTVYAYDSMVSEYGLGPKVIPKFEQRCNCKVNMVAKGDAGAVLNALVLEKQNPRADVVVGIDNSMVASAIDANILEKFTPQNISIVDAQLRFDKDGYFTPYDYGYFTFVYNAREVDFKLNSFNALLDSRLRKKVLIQNPRTSSPGLGLLLWTVSVYGDPGYKQFWKEFRPNVLTVTAGWDESAGLFAQGEAPVYFSYITSPPYYVQFEDINHYLGANFEEGHYLQIEGSAIVKGTKNRLLAEQFIEFTLEEQFQNEIPLNQFMFPVNENIELPASYSYAPVPNTILELDSAIVAQKQGEWISEWEKIMQSG
ncbi:MAG TPA: thiamine ABC transporter substrate binding subunit [archaeon]|nr:thiamine ABC transporter substrate binding subunit [archaeon]